MTAEEVYDSVTNGGAHDFAAAVEIFDRFGSWCLIGGLAVNCYAEPVYTIDANFVVIARADVVRGKVWTWQDGERRLTKRKKDELDLLRLAEANPLLRANMPREIVQQLEGNS